MPTCGFKSKVTSTVITLLLAFITLLVAYLTATASVDPPNSLSGPSEIGAVSAPAGQESLGVNQPSSDPQAISIVQQAVAANGGAEALASISDFTASGTITLNENPSGPVSASFRGTKSAVRLDAFMPKGTRSLILNNGIGGVRREDGHLLRMNRVDSISTYCVNLPFFELLSALNNVAPIPPLKGSSFSVKYEGEVALNGRQVYQIRLQYLFPRRADPLGMLSASATAELFIDSQTYTVTRVSRIWYPEGRRDRAQEDDLDFSDYRPNSGVLVPFSISERVLGQQIWRFLVASYSFNNGITVATFEF